MEENREVVIGNEFEFEDDGFEFDIGALKQEYEPKIFGNKDDDENQIEKELEKELEMAFRKEEMNDDEKNEDETQSRPASSEDQIKYVKTQAPLIQAPFQPGSTPTHFQQRFMVWNSVGLIMCYNTEIEKSINIEFHDSTVHHSIHIPNVQNYSLADLSQDAVVFATNGDDIDVVSKLFCMVLSTFDSTKEWQIEMAKDELIEALTLGNDFIAIATNRRFIRVFTIGGIQTQLFSIPGPVLCLASHENQLMIIYHNGSGILDEQNLSMLLLKIDHKVSYVKQTTPNPFPIALSEKSKVYWAGFTDEGTPCIVDSDSVIRVLKDFIGNTWIPIFTKEYGKTNHNYFVIGLSEIQNQIRCILCKKGRYPDTVPRPTVILVPMQMPVCQLYSGKGKLEEEQLRHKILVRLLKKLANDGFDVDSQLELSNVKVVESLIKLFALALGAGRESLAQEIAYLMPNQSAVEGAVKYAHSKNYRNLAQKLVEVAQQKLDEEANEAHEHVQNEHGDYFSQNPGKDSLVNRQSYSDDVQLKPKSFKNPPVDIVEESSNSKFTTENYQRSDSETETKMSFAGALLDDQDSNDPFSLKPKRVENGTRKGNPFKINNEMKKLTKIRSRNSDDDDDDDLSEDEEFDKKLAFDYYYEEMRDKIHEDNSDVEDEDELLKVAKKQFNLLDHKTKKKWMTQANNSKKRKCNEKNNENNMKKSKPTANSITNYINKGK